MEAVIFIGLQASGKSTFYRQRFFRTHVRTNMDMLSKVPHTSIIGSVADLPGLWGGST